MRQVLSWRFVAAIAAVTGLALVAYLISSQQSSSGFSVASNEATRRMDFISLVAAIRTENFEMTANGTVSGSLTLVMPNGRNVQVFPGTPGVVRCENLTQQYQCAVLGQALGDSIVWFALMPMRAGTEFRFQLPAILDLEDGFAQLENGWEVPFARTIDRSECDPDAATFAEFLEERGTEFVSIYDLTEQAIVAVDC